MKPGLALSIDQFVKAWRLMCSPAAGYENVRAPRVEYVFSGLPISFFNAVFVTGDCDAASLRSMSAAAREWAASRPVPYFFITTREMTAAGAGEEAALASAGFAPAMQLTGMIANGIATGAPVPDGLDLATPLDDASCTALVDVNGAAYGMDLGESRGLLGVRSFWKDHHVVVGSVGGTPVCCSAVLTIDGYRYVALVATHPDHRRKGYADAAMRRSLEDSARAAGPSPSFLHATDAGRPVYQRMGFEPVCLHTLYMETRFLEGHSE
jgi:GNAT superfamily N-acetyltransferase